LKPNFFAVIIGSEILQGRRDDSHFSFLRDELSKRGWRLSGVYIIEDNPKLMEDTFSLLKSISNSVIFSFGGIGATPDDYTREVVGKVFRNGDMEFHQEFKDIIIKKFGVENSQYRVNLAYLPKNSQLLYDNPINGMCGFQLDNRFFFTPGFPQMAHPMVCEALNLYYPKSEVQIFSHSIVVNSAESSLIDWMNGVENGITLSSLPKIEKDENGNLTRSVEIKIESENSKIVDKEFDKLLNFLKEKDIKYSIIV